MPQKGLYCKVVVMLSGIIPLVVVNSSYCEQPESAFVYDEFIQGGAIKDNVLKVANEYVSEHLRNTGYLAVQDKSTNSQRKFAVVEVFDVVSRKGDVYTVQVDTDEIGGEPRYLLLLDLKQTGSEFHVWRIRINGRHLRQRSASLGVR